MSRLHRRGGKSGMVLPLRSVALIMLNFVAACGGRGGSGETPAPRPVADVDSAGLASPTVAWTAGIVDLPESGSEIAVLASVRQAQHAGFDRIVFEFTPGARPAVHAEYVDRPVRQCGSGEVVNVAGDGWLLVKFTPAAAHTEEGKPTVGERERLVNLPLLKELEMICDFEADVSWVLGVGAPNHYRLFALSDPPRAVLDIRY